MNVGTENSLLPGEGIGNNSANSNINIYGQSTGENQGQLFVYSWGPCLWAYNGDLNCSSAKITAYSESIGIKASSSVTLKDATINATTPSQSGIQSDGSMTINGGEVTASGNQEGIYANGPVTINGSIVSATGYAGIACMSAVTINGGQVTATGGENGYGIFALGDITLGWTNPTDYIYANSYQADGTITLTKTFIDEDGNTYESGTVSASAIDGKTLYPEGVILKHIAGYNNGGGWYLIAPPVEELTPAAGNGFLSNEYDLYRFNPSNEGNEWENYKAESFNLVNGQGYLYANSDTTTLVFTGVPIAGHTYEIELVYDANDEHKCWNLVGNPFGCNATLNRQYYVLSADGTGINPVAIPATTPIPPCTAVFVKAVSAGDTAVFSKVTQ